MQRFHTLPMTLAMLSLLVVCGLASSTFARPRGQEHDRLARLEQHIDKLGLDEATRAAIHATIDEAQAEQSKIYDHLREAYNNLRTLMQQDLPDETVVLAQLDSIGAFETAHKKQATLAWLTALTQLTPEQRASLRDTVRGRGDGKKGQEQ